MNWTICVVSLLAGVAPWAEAPAVQAGDGPKLPDRFAEVVLSVEGMV